MEAQKQKAVPLGIAPGGTVTRNVTKGQIFSQANFAPDDSTFIHKLRRQQDEWLAREGRGA